MYVHTHVPAVHRGQKGASVPLELVVLCKSNKCSYLLLLLEYLSLQPLSDKVLLFNPDCLSNCKHIVGSLALESPYLVVCVSVYIWLHICYSG